MRNYCNEPNTAEMTVDICGTDAICLLVLLALPGTNSSEIKTWYFHAWQRYRLLKAPSSQEPATVFLSTIVSTTKDANYLRLQESTTRRKVKKVTIENKKHPMTHRKKQTQLRQLTFKPPVVTWDRRWPSLSASWTTFFIQQSWKS